ncbi:hypothetical protein V6N13_102070 [Hibiscus sabdariffa]
MAEGEAIGKLGIALEQLGILGQKMKRKVNKIGTQGNDAVLELGDDVSKPKGNEFNVGPATQVHPTSSTCYSELGSGSAFGYFLGFFGSRNLIRGKVGGGGGSVEIGLIGFSDIWAVACPVTRSAAFVATFSGRNWIVRSNSSGIGMVGFGGVGAVMRPVAGSSTFVATRRS